MPLGIEVRRQRTVHRRAVGIDLVLIAAHQSVDEAAAELHAAVETFVDLELHLEDEVAVLAFGAEERIGRIGRRRADNRAVDNLERGVAAHAGPPLECLAVEELHPILLRRCGDAERRTDEGQNQFFHIVLLLNFGLYDQLLPLPEPVNPGFCSMGRETLASMTLCGMGKR